jgi:hypothetical protein
MKEGFRESRLGDLHHGENAEAGSLLFRRKRWKKFCLRLDESG